MASTTLDSVDSADLLASIASGIMTRSQSRQQAPQHIEVEESRADSSSSSSRSSPTARLNVIEPMVRELAELLPGLRLLIERTNESLSPSPIPTPSPTQTMISESPTQIMDVPHVQQSTMVETLAIAIFARETTKLIYPEGKEGQLDHCQETIFRTLRLALDKLIGWDDAARVMAPSITRLLQYYLVERAKEKEDAWHTLASNKVTIAKAAETVARSWLKMMHPSALDRPEEHKLQDALSLAADQIADSLNLRRPNYRGGRGYGENRTAASKQTTPSAPILFQIQAPGQTAPQTTVPTLSSEPQVAALLSALQAQVTKHATTPPKKPGQGKRQRK